MFCLLLLGEGLNKRSELRVPVDQMLAAQLTGYLYHLCHSSERATVD
jgi:hypothetical protein